MVGQQLTTFSIAWVRQEWTYIVKTFNGLHLVVHPVYLFLSMQRTVTGICKLSDCYTGDCWYLSALGSLATRRNVKLLDRLIPSKQNFEQGYTGKINITTGNFTFVWELLRGVEREKKITEICGDRAVNIFYCCKGSWDVDLTQKMLKDYP